MGKKKKDIDSMNAEEITTLMGWSAEAMASLTEEFILNEEGLYDRFVEYLRKIALLESGG